MKQQSTSSTDALLRVGRRRLLHAIVLQLLGCLVVLHVDSASAQTYSVPIRWCVVANDTNDDGDFDAGEDGAPAFTDPAAVGEPDTDNLLWRRHERISEATYIPQADVTLRSGLYNIVEDATLRFPIIPDQDTSDPNHQIGEVTSPGTDNTEWTNTYNACVDAWRDDHGVEDIGIVAVVVRDIVDGTPGFDLQGVGWLGQRRVMVEDNAWSLPASTLNNSAVDDGVDKLLGHEVGHTWPTAASPETNTDGLRHVCSAAQGGEDDNILRQGRQDLDGDNLLDNSQLSTSVAQITDRGADDSDCTGDDTTEAIDQIAAIQGSTSAVPGCKLNGTNTDCTQESDVRTDRVGEVEQPFLDLSVLTITEDSPNTRIAFELLGRLTVADLSGFTVAEYVVVADTDNDLGTGGRPGSLGLPTEFQGAELAVRVSATPTADNEFLNLRPAVWRFQQDEFVQVVDRRIRAFLRPMVAIIDYDNRSEEVHTSDVVVVELPDSVRGTLSEPFRVQSVVRGVRSPQPVVVDRLDDSPEERGREFRLRSPTFPTCNVVPDLAAAGGLVTVTSRGLLPSRGVHVVFGSDAVATGTSDATGRSSVNFQLPADAAVGKHLVTVGTDGTALTADCTVEVAEVAYQYAAKLVCGVQRDPRDLRLTRGVYATTVNVHNPGPEPVVFEKTLALTYPPGDEEPGKVIPIARARLEPKQALAADCNEIAERVFNGSLPAPYIEGFVVIESPMSLDVTAVYTSATVDEKGQTGDVRSIDVEAIEERSTARSSERARKR